jgi:prepilin-type N-terminal cleavage/methylation domain-containing protein
VDDTRGAADRGFTLIEIAVAVAIVATTVAAGVGISLASRSFVVSAAAAEFDHLLDSARTIARETQGATIVFAPDAYGDGTEVRVLAPGPNSTLVATSMPVLHTHAVIEEQQSLGKAPFALVVHASGALGGRPGFRLGDSTASGEVGCPASGSFHFAIHTAGTTADRFIPCRITLAATGPIALASWPPAPIAPLPTPCSAGPCAPAALPTPPSSNASCPPAYTAVAGGCAPPPPASGPRYHVSASLASATMTVGGPDDSIVAAADLTNPGTVPAGTPLQLPVLIQSGTATTCTTLPLGPQRSGTTFTVKAIAAGTCTLTVTADPSGVPGATADTATFNIPVSDSAAASPTIPPLACDLNANGKCYHRIVDSVAQMFYKYVDPDYECSVTDNSSSCQYIDSIKRVYIGLGYGVQPLLPPIDSGHELLFQILSIRTVINACQPFSYIANIPVGDPISWGGYGVGSPVDAPVGFGEPSVFSRANYVMTGNLPNGYLTEPNTIWNEPTTFIDLYEAVAKRLVDKPYIFSYYSADATMQSLVWYPDFPGCDVAGDASSRVMYGNTGVELEFNIFQAVNG